MLVALAYNKQKSKQEGFFIIYIYLNFSKP